MKKTLLAALSGVLFAGIIVFAQTNKAPVPKDLPYRVDKIVLCTDVQEREPVGEAGEFDISVERLWCWTRIIAENIPTTVKHVWYVDGKKTAEITLNVKYPRTRTWSNKAVGAGKWKVEVVSADGKVLAVAEAKVKKQSKSE